MRSLATFFAAGMDHDEPEPAVPTRNLSRRQFARQTGVEYVVLWTGGAKADYGDMQALLHRAKAEGS